MGTAAPVAGSTPQDARIAAVKGDDKENAAVRESPHGKLAFLDVVQANVGPVDPLRCLPHCLTASLPLCLTASLPLHWVH